ncbi:hypothetical protein FOA52_015936 [Chlamydomonas sp. UWO 241]|nr:hypothetical protein FOA52_015936 [Chlamydomonas sp. UWO 241]
MTEGRGQRPRGWPSPPMGAGHVGAAAGVGLATLLWHYHARALKPTEIFVADGPLRRRVLPHCTTLLRPYRPPLLATNTHVQTVLGIMRTGTMRMGTYNRQLLFSTDGGTCALDWWRGCDKADAAPADAPVFLVLHGINGGSFEGYCKWACTAAVARGWRACVLNYRGCNGLRLTAPRGYNAALSPHDVHTAVASIRGRFPAARVVAAGYSLGGVILAKYLAEADQGLHGDWGLPRAAPLAGQAAAVTRAGASCSSGEGGSSGGGSGGAAGGAGGEGEAWRGGGAASPSPASDGSGSCSGRGGGKSGSNIGEGGRGGQGGGGGSGGDGEGGGGGAISVTGSGLHAAAIVSSPVCLTKSQARLEHPWTFPFIYNLALAFKLREYITGHKETIIRGGKMDVARALSSFTISGIDGSGVSPDQGFESTQKYNEEACSLQYLPGINTPTLLLMSKDDPFLGVLPDKECAANPSTLLAATSRGGHVAFLQGCTGVFGPAFMDDAVMEFLSATMEHYYDTTAGGGAARPAALRSKL